MAEEFCYEPPTNKSTEANKNPNVELSLDSFPIYGSSDQTKLLVFFNEDNENLAIRINSMMERVTEGNLKWKCTICGKCTKGSRAQMVRHVESHMEGVSHYCNRCCKVSRSGAALQVHMSKFHRL